MLKNLKNNTFRILIFSLLVFVLACIRALENQLFYDPFLDYFKKDFLNFDLPEFNFIKLFLNLFLRYFLNSITSLLIIYLAFKDLDIIKFSTLLYVFFFFLLTISLFIVVVYFPENKMILFYIRRFIIQPIFLMLFLPGFYFQRKIK
ncbi:MAG: exosortase F system-associated protein [Flavobacterium sp.]|nr:exosortase F system-associated protein [Flavobacterium sp.]